MSTFSAASVEADRPQRSICQHCGRGIYRENSTIAWTCPVGPGLQGDTDECHAAPNPEDGPMPGHLPGVIAIKPLD